MLKPRLKIIIPGIAIALLAISALIAGNTYASTSIASRVKGMIVLQVEKNGEAWYINPADLKRYYLGTPDLAFELMKKLSVGITDANLAKMPVGLIADSNTDTDKDGLNDDLEISLGTDPKKSDSDGDGFNDKNEIQGNYNPKGTGSLIYDSAFTKTNSGKIFLQVEKSGQAWYVNPTDQKRYFLNRPSDAFSIMRKLGLGITTADLEKITMGSTGGASNSLSTNLKGPELCGDGVCNNVEKANPNLCPKDCTPTNTETEIYDLKYSSVNSDAVKLDLYLPSGTCTGKFPLVIDIHGGAFKAGDKSTARNKFVTENCYAYAPINYRLSGEATFPAGVEDAKSAVRWLRANADKYNLDSEHFGVIGGSAGGYFAAFLGATGDIKDFDTGDNLAYSSAVQAVVDEFGPVDMSSLYQDRIDSGFPQDPAESAFIGCDISSQTCSSATKASPINYVSKEDPPFFILHGAKDKTIPLIQSQKLYTALQNNNVPATLTVLPNAGHGSPEFDDYEKEILEFFDKYLKK